MTREREIEEGGSAGRTRFRDSAWGRWLPVALYAAFIFGLSSLTMPPILGPMELNDKVKHFALYGVFSAFVVRALAPGLGRRPALLVFFTVLLVSAYGATDEYHQYFVPGRGADAADWLVDTLSALVVSVLFILRRR